MNLETAKSKSIRNRVLGWTLSLASIPIISMSLIKYIYITMREIDFNIANKICSYIASLYENSNIFRFGWSISPDIHNPILISIDNTGLLALLALFLLGATIKNNGENLARRIAEVCEEAENQRWQMAINGLSPARGTTIDVNIESNEKWYTKVFQGILISVIAGYLVLALGKVSNL